ncbi:MAG: DNA-protecting protein DprA [Actinobacteria bacterium]|nr:DNA-protecting protein DprA [Actinomycetota bacterium]
MREPLTEIREQRLALFSVVAVGNAFWSQQIQEFGIESVYQNLFFGVYNGEKFGKMITEVNAFDSEQALQNICNSGGVFLTPEEEKWPKQVSSLSNPPIGLVVKGNVETLKNKSLAIVGTRNPTPYGIRIAGDFAAGFVDREWDIVSGGAYGIDSAAHRGALVAEGRTIAVIASGIDIQYPAGNSRLFDEICETGAIVSEVMPGVIAMPHRFLTRNRLIAALSQSTLVVEAAFRSGSLRTARDAAELMRPVMAIPGPINSPSSEGCHRLIGERAAELVTSVADAIELITAL